MHFLSAKHSRDDMLFIGTVSSHFYLRTLAEARRKESRLPSAQFILGQRMVIMAYRIKHYRDNRIDIMRRCGLLDILYTKFSGNGGAHFIYIQTDAFNLR